MFSLRVYGHDHCREQRHGSRITYEWITTFIRIIKLNLETRAKTIIIVHFSDVISIICTFSQVRNHWNSIFGAKD